MKKTDNVGHWTFPKSREEAHEQIKQALQKAAEETKRIKELRNVRIN